MGLPSKSTGVATSSRISAVGRRAAPGSTTTGCRHDLVRPLSAGAMRRLRSSADATSPVGDTFGAHFLH
jgi:hypothetical protein